MRGSTNPPEYLRKTLDLIQSRALSTSAVNWSAVRSKATTMAAGARTTAAMSPATPAGWIVDLRGNTGANMWPMLVGIGPLLGKRTLGSFKYSETAVPWFYENGTASVIPPLGKHVKFELPRSLADLPDAPVAVLTDRTTMSFGEALAISFKGRPRTRFFGVHTSGLTTANETFKLADGATLYLTTSIEQDRQGKCYPEGVDPDVSAGQNSVPLGDRRCLIRTERLSPRPRIGGVVRFILPFI